MKNLFLILLLTFLSLLTLSSCNNSGSEQTTISAADYSADTAQIRLLLDSFSLYMDSNLISKTLAFGEKALAIAKKIKYENGMADAFRWLGLYYGSLGDYPKGMEYQIQALKLNEKNNEENKIARNLMDIGIIHLHQKNYDKAIQYYQRSMNLFQKLQSENGIATIQYLLALVYSEQGLDSAALQYFNLALDTQKKLGGVRRIAECEQCIGDIYLGRGQYTEALQHYNSSYEHFTEVNETMGFAIIDLSLAKLFLQKNEIAKAEKYALSSNKYFENIHYRAHILETYEVLHKIYAAKKDFKNAYRYQDKRIALHDSIMGEENQMKLAGIQRDYELEKSHSELELQQKQLRTQKTLRNFFIAGFGIVVILAFLTFKQYRIKNKTANRLEETLQHLKATQEQLIYTEKMSSLGKLSAGIAHEIQNPLNFVNNFSDLGINLIDELSTVKNEEERNEILSELKGNLKKVNEHGKRADGIVKSMLEHTHIGSREKRPTDINYMANEFFTLAYQSFRAKEPGFTCRIEKHYAQNLPLVNVNPQDISRVMINLFNNALYALNKKSMTDNSFAPRITLLSEQRDNKIIFSVQDNGNGIPQDLREKIFQPFFTTKSSGEGTGLGLSLSHEVITKGHGGTLEVKSVEGEGSEFIITLPV